MSELERLKSIQIESVKLAAKNKITAIYPIEKQLNIIRFGSGFTQTDLDQMNIFIDSIRDQVNGFESQINNAALEQLIEFDFSPDIFK